MFQWQDTVVIIKLIWIFLGDTPWTLRTVFYVRRRDHRYDHCKLYPLHVHSSSSMDKQMYNTASIMFSLSKHFLAFRMMPTHFATFLLLYVICGDQFSWQAMMTPRNLVPVTSIILFPSINIPFIDRGTHFDVNSMKFVLPMFRESLLALNPCIYVSNIFIDFRNNIIYIVSGSKEICIISKRIGITFPENKYICW